MTSPCFSAFLRATGDLEDAVKALNLEYEQPIPGQDIFVIHNFAEKFGLNPAAAQQRLRDNYPRRHGTDPIEWGKPQWVCGDHVALRYRGNVLGRCKMWFQNGDPLVEGFIRYYYTGWQKKVLPATANVASVPFLDAFTRAVNGWLKGHGQLETNHYIVTEYANENDGIGQHYDKARSIHHDSVILVVKTGECGRPFVITENKGDKDDPDRVLYEAVVPPGSAVLMSMKANLATKHGVPVVKEAAAPSGSIVLRTICERMTPRSLAQVLAKDAELAARKRKREAEAAKAEQVAKAAKAADA